jgi:hypothetical protein
MLMNATSRFQVKPVSFEPQLHPNQNQNNQQHYQRLPYQRPGNHHNKQDQRFNQSLNWFSSTFLPRKQTEVHQQSTEQQQRLVEMTGNEVNAWSVHRGGSSSNQGSSSNNSWAPQSQDFFENAENFSVGALSLHQTKNM